MTLSVSHAYDSAVLIADRVLTAGDFATRGVWKAPASARAEQALEVMIREDYDAAPLDEHPVWRYVDRAQLDGSDGTVADSAVPITAAELVPGSLGVISTIRALSRRRYYFVYGTSEVDGIVTLSDLQRHTVAVAVLAVLLAAEQGLQLAIQGCGGEDWIRHLSAERQVLAQQVFDERRRRNVEIGLLDCLPLEDILTITRKLSEFRSSLGYGGREFDRWSDELKAVRNTLAHAGDLLSAFPDPTAAVGFVLEAWDFTDRVWRSRVLSRT